MSRPQGQHKTPLERAQDQLEAQRTAVQKAVQKRDNAREQAIKYQAIVDEANAALEVERELLEYYKAHPLLKRQEQVKPDPEPMLPFQEEPQDEGTDADAPRETVFKGFKGRVVAP